VLVGEDFAERYETVRRYLKQRDGQWDVFSGFIADVHPDMDVLHVEEFDGVTFVHVNKTVSMVFNVYSKSAIDYLADWEVGSTCVNTNTIDRYLERRDPNRVVTTFPFLVAHRSDLDSTIWGCNNADYSPMIIRSAGMLKEKIEAFKNGQRSTLGSADSPIDDRNGSRHPANGVEAE
jgi:hypothetical protein